MTTYWGALRRRAAGDRGSLTLEMVVLAPGLLLLISFAIFVGRVTTAGQAVEQAAAAAARTASIARTAGAAQFTATEAARTTLTQQNIACASTTVTVDTSGFTRPVGTAATITTTVTCVLDLSSLGPGIPGTRTLSGTSVSPLDTYRART
jgi:Flp pilus assembly protein TadG